MKTDDGRRGGDDGVQLRLVETGAGRNGWGNFAQIEFFVVGLQGLARGFAALDLRVIGSIAVSWVVTLPAGGILAALFYFTLKGMFT